jgi:hypothetical protein
MTLKKRLFMESALTGGQMERQRRTNHNRIEEATK